jgi:hypothetical protein
MNDKELFPGVDKRRFELIAERLGVALEVSGIPTEECTLAFVAGRMAMGDILGASHTFAPHDSKKEYTLTEDQLHHLFHLVVRSGYAAGYEVAQEDAVEALFEESDWLDEADVADEDWDEDEEEGKGYDMLILDDPFLDDPEDESWLRGILWLADDEDKV